MAWWQGLSREQKMLAGTVGAGGGIGLLVLARRGMKRGTGSAGADNPSLVGVGQGGNPPTFTDGGISGWQTLQDEIDALQGLSRGPAGPAGPRGLTGPAGPAGDGYRIERIQGRESLAHLVQRLHPGWSSRQSRDVAGALAHKAGLSVRDVDKAQPTGKAFWVR